MSGRGCGVAAALGITSLALALAWTAPAHAQQSDPALRPTRGPMITGAERTGDPDATAVELNPGALGLLRAASLELVDRGGRATARSSRGGASASIGPPRSSAARSASRSAG